MAFRTWLQALDNIYCPNKKTTGIKTGLAVEEILTLLKERCSRARTSSATAAAMAASYLEARATGKETARTTGAIGAPAKGDGKDGSLSPESPEQLLDLDRDVSELLLEKCGIWGGLLGGVICSKISQYILTCDISQRLEFAIMAGYFFKVFTDTLIHKFAILHSQDFGSEGDH